MEIEVAAYVFSLIGCLLAGGVGGFFLARYLIKKELEKNPPINRNMIRAMFQSMGRTASETQINQVMNNINKHK